MLRYPTTLLGLALLFAPLAAEDAPDALAVEWQGKKLCENLHEDNYIRIMRCTMPPGAVHIRHSHPVEFIYALSTGKAKVENANGTIEVPIIGDQFSIAPPIPWHEVTNIGDATLRFLIVEKKYRPGGAATK